MEDGYKMKKLLNIIIVLAAAVCMSCTKEDIVEIRQMEPAAVGEWHLIEETCEGQDVPTLAEVYLCIKSDCTFELYQKTGTQTRFFLYTGSCYSEDGNLIGEYSDGTAWGSAYQVTYDDDRLILSSKDKMGKMIFEKKSLADEEKKNADIALRSSQNGFVLPIL